MASSRMNGKRYLLKTFYHLFQRRSLFYWKVEQGQLHESRQCDVQLSKSESLSYDLWNVLLLIYNRSILICLSEQDGITSNRIM